MNTPYFMGRKFILVPGIWVESWEVWPMRLKLKRGWPTMRLEQEGITYYRHWGGKLGHMLLPQLLWPEPSTAQGLWSHVLSPQGCHVGHMDPLLVLGLQADLQVSRLEHLAHYRLSAWLCILNQHQSSKTSPQGQLRDLLLSPWWHGTRQNCPGSSSEAGGLQNP
jgi:hypothetical protein